jgi:hypothetical protein
MPPEPKHQVGGLTRVRPLAAIIAQMPSPDDEITVTVTLAVGSDPIRGTAALPGGEQRGFWGWLEFVEIVQEALERGSGAPGTGVAGPRSAA